MHFRRSRQSNWPTDPHERNGDEQGAMDNGMVTTPDGFKDAYKTYIEGGWVGLSGNPSYGGMGMPKMLSVQFEEMLYAADSSFALYSPSLQALFSH